MNPIPEFKFKGRQLDKEETANLMSLLLASKKGTEMPMKDDPELMKLFPAQVAAKRIEVYPLPFCLTNLFFIMSIMTFVRSPGNVMGLLWLAKNYSDKRKKSLLTLEDWCEIFPWGVPTEKEFITWWGTQKVAPEDRGPMEPDNLVDYSELWGCPKIPPQDSAV
jgi:hypothetical protein